MRLKPTTVSSLRPCWEVRDRTIDDLSIHRENDDYFRWIAPADGTARFDLMFSHAGGDIDVTLHRDDPEHTQVAFANSSTDNESITAQVTAGEGYLLHVYGYSAATNWNIPW